MDKIKKLRNRIAALTAAMRELHSKAVDDDGKERGLNEQEQASFDSLEAERAEVKAALAREEHLQQLERDLIPTEPPPTGTTGATPVDDGGEPSEPEEFASLGEQLRAVAAAADPSRTQDSRLRQAATGLSEGIASEGGFLVQTDFVAGLMQRAYNNSQILSGSGFANPTRIPISSNANGMKLNGLNETSRADGSRWGGVRAYWAAEAAEKTASKPDFRQIELNLRKLIGLCYATDELLQDAAALEAVISNAFAQEFAFKIQDALINGTGAGLPLGVLNAACRVQVDKETGQAATTLVAENIEKMWARMWVGGLPNSVWLINQDCYPQLFSMSKVVGVGGVPVYMPPGGLSVAPFGTLMGRPVVPIEQCQTLGTEGDIIFADFGEYLFCDKGGMQSAQSIHVRFIYDETVFRFVYRCDGQPTWASALTPYKGTDTVGPFVVLKVRS